MGAFFSSPSRNTGEVATAAVVENATVTEPEALLTEPQLIERPVIERPVIVRPVIERQNSIHIQRYFHSNASMPHYYCHQCHREFYSSEPNCVCPNCAGGFVEDISHSPGFSNLPSISGNSSPTSQSNSNVSSGISLSSNSSGSSVSSTSIIANERSNRLLVQYIRTRIATLLRQTMRNGQVFAISVATDPNGSAAPPPAGAAGGRTNSGGANADVGGLPDPSITFIGSNDPNLVALHIFLSIIRAYGPLRNTFDEMLNGNDLDRIVAQFLTQMDSRFSREKILKVSTVQITAEDVEKKRQCSICWEEYQLKESVGKLSCSHIFHKHCIRPWLEQHGTCPLCRKSMLEDDTENAQTTNSNPTPNR